MKNFKEFKMNEGKDEFAPDKTLKNQYCYYCEYHLKKKKLKRKD